jgi:exodeoxyribonuclease VII small subunit
MAKSEINIEKLSYEKALSELETIVQQLENQSLELETTLKLFKRGKLLLDHCQKLLATAELKVRELPGIKNAPVDDSPG